MREQAADLERLGAAVYAITFESQSRVERYQADDPLPFPVLRDPSRAAYRAFGLGRRPATTVWGPETILYYARQLLRLRYPRSSRGSDPYQLGGDVVVRADQSGGWIYRSRNPADRPDAGRILALLEHEAGQVRS